MLILKLKGTTEANLAPLTEVNKLDLELAVINIIEVDVFAEHVLYLVCRIVAHLWPHVLEQVLLLVHSQL